VRSTYFSEKVSNREFSISDFLLRRLGSNLSETGSIRKQTSPKWSSIKWAKKAKARSFLAAIAAAGTS